MVSGSGLLSLVTPAGKVPGTGVLQTSALFKQQFGDNADPSIVKVIISALPALFGQYPDHSDVAPSAVFVAIFGVLCIAYFYIFAKDYQRGHRFWPFFGLGCYCILRMLGWGLRINWAGNVMHVQMGIACQVFILVSVLIVNMMIMLFGHRIFTWRHPETGNSRLFNLMMNTIYLLVIAIIVMGIVGQTIPFVYFLSEKNLHMCQKVVRVAAVTQVFYAFQGVQLIILAYSFPPGSLDHRFGKSGKHVLPKTLSATWIESTGLFYFPRKGSQEITHKGDPEAEFSRVIPSDVAPGGGLVEHNDDHPNGPKIRTGIILVFVVSLILSISSAFRCASTFISEPIGGTAGDPVHWIFRNWLMYLLYGAFEVVVSVLLLVFRADLRFYIPDMPSKAAARKMRSNNTVVPFASDNVQKTESSHLA